MSLYKVSKEQGNSETSEERLVKVELRIRCTEALLGEEIKVLPPFSLGEEYSQMDRGGRIQYTRSLKKDTQSRN